MASDGLGTAGFLLHYFFYWPVGSLGSFYTVSSAVLYVSRQRFTFLTLSVRLSQCFFNVLRGAGVTSKFSPDTVMGPDNGSRFSPDVSTILFAMVAPILIFT